MLSGKLARWGACCALGLAAVTQAATVEVYPLLNRGESADLGVYANTRKLCEIKIASAADDTGKTAACRFELPADAAALEVRGEYGGVHWQTQKRYLRKGTQTWSLVDFAPVGGLLNQAGKPYGARMAEFIPAAKAFAAKHLGEAAASAIETVKPARDADIVAAEKRLGFKLPPDFVSLLGKVGAMRVGDHYTMDATDIADADTQMRKSWGTPDEAMAREYSPKQRERLRASTILFTEVGDGLGGLLYSPPPNSTCGDKPYYRWISQEGGDYRLLKPGRVCMDFAEAFRWLLDGFLVSDYADALDTEKQSLLIDSSAGVQPLVLRIEPERFHIGLEWRWQGPNGHWREPD